MQEKEAAKMVENKGRKEEVVTREYTINLHKRLHGWYFLLLHYGLIVFLDDELMVCESGIS